MKNQNLPLSNGWIPLKDKAPNLGENGEKILIYRIVNEAQEPLAISIYDTNMTKHCNPDETWWMELPKPPSVPQQ